MTPMTAIYRRFLDSGGYILHGRCVSSTFQFSATQAVLVLTAIGTITSVTTVTTFGRGSGTCGGDERCTSSPAPISVSRRGWRCMSVTAVTNTACPSPPIQRSEFLYASTRCRCWPFGIWVKTKCCHLACYGGYIQDPANGLRRIPLPRTWVNKRLRQ